MSHQSDLIESDIIAYLKQHERKELLRLLETLGEGQTVTLLNKFALLLFYYSHHLH